MINKIPNFKHHLLTIGELPASYLVSMTYEEQLLWFCNYLENTLLPKMNELISAFNENAEQLQEEFDTVIREMQELSQSVDDRLANFMTELSANIVTIANTLLEEKIANGELIVSLGIDYNESAEALTFNIASATANEIQETLSTLADPSEV